MVRRQLGHWQIVLAAWLLVACAGEDALSEDAGVVADASVLHDAGSPEDWSSLNERPCPDGSILTYENFGDAFMRNWCTGCHGVEREEGARQYAPLDVDFDTLDDVRAWAPAIWVLAADTNRAMPPVGGPTETERAKLGEWLACGAPARDD